MTNGGTFYNLLHSILDRSGEMWWDGVGGCKKVNKFNPMGLRDYIQNGTFSYNLSLNTYSISNHSAIKINFDDICYLNHK